MKYEILNASGQVINTIMASADFVNKNFPGMHRPVNSDAEKAAEVRAERDRLLQASDYTQLQDADALARASWATYRKALRDLPKQAGFPWTVTWPVAPT